MLPYPNFIFFFLPFFFLIRHAEKSRSQFETVSRNQLNFEVESHDGEVLYAYLKLSKSCLETSSTNSTFQKPLKTCCYHLSAAGPWEFSPFLWPENYHIKRKWGRLSVIQTCFLVGFGAPFLAVLRAYSWWDHFWRALRNIHCSGGWTRACWGKGKFPAHCTIFSSPRHRFMCAHQIDHSCEKR